MRRRLMFYLAWILILSGLCFSADISPPVEAWQQGAGEGERLVVWIFLRDKGSPGGLIEERIAEAAGALSPRAVERRLRARPSRPFDEKDLPLHRPYVKALEQEGVRFRTFSRWLNAVSAGATRAQIDRVARLPFVRSIRRVSGRKGGPLPETEPVRGRVSPLDQYGPSYRQLEQIQVTDLHAEGYTGDGVIVAVFDTGFWLEHECLAGANIILERDFINDDWETGNEPGDDPYQHYHGTAVLSLLAGYNPGTLLGAAYDAEYFIAKTEDLTDEQPIEEDWWIEAAEWADSLGAQVISSSLCYNDWYTYEDMDGETAPITNAADQAVINGIVVCNAAGNSGSSEWTYILAPADGDSVISVGSVDSTGTRSGFSSLGPTYDGRIKPTIMAMGSATFIAYADSVNHYRNGYGTSFSCPLTAGAVALMLQKNPTWTSREVLDAVMETGTQASAPDTLCGWGTLQALDASNHDPWSAVASTGLQLRALDIRPNPCGSSFQIRCAGTEGKLPVSLYDVRGRLLGRVWTDGSGTSEVDVGLTLPDVAPGIMVLRAPGYAPTKVLVLRP